MLAHSEACPEASQPELKACAVQLQLISPNLPNTTRHLTFFHINKLC